MPFEVVLWTRVVYMWLIKPRICQTSVLTGIISLLIFLTSPAQAQNQTQIQWKTRPSVRSLDLKWQFKSAGRSLSQGRNQESQISNEQIFESKLNLDSHYWLSDELFFGFQPSIRFQTGRIQTLDGANAPSNSVGLKKAALQWLPSNYFWLSAGALNQGEIHSSLVADELPFPGARISAKTSFSNFDLLGLVESSIPSSNSLQTGTTQIEAVPMKNAAQIQLNWQPKSYLFSKNRLGYFSYQNLPSEVAEASSLMGNTTTRLSTEQWAFAYKYQGLEASSDWQLPLTTKIDFLIQAAAAQNQSAPSAYNTGYSAYTGLRYLMNSRHDIQFGGRYFRVEPDTAPSYYSNYGNFRTNRVGYSSEALWHLKKQKFSLAASYSEAQVIFEDPTQSRIRSFEIRLETDYEAI